MARLNDLALVAQAKTTWDYIFKTFKLQFTSR